MHEPLKLPSRYEAQLAGWPRFTPLEAIGPTLHECVLIGTHEFLMLRPAEPDRLLEHPATLEGFARDEYMPYWCDLWPASRMLAKAILNEKWKPGTPGLELGCGLGMPGVAALKQNLHITFSDYDATALRFAACNALVNTTAPFELLPLDWCNPPKRTYPIIFAADLLYEMRSVAPLVALLESMLAGNGIAWITDQDRTPSTLWRKALSDRGFAYQEFPFHAGQPAAPGQIARRVKGTLYKIRRG
jgi:predicted nicotinamide N-methyase